MNTVVHGPLLMRLVAALFPLRPGLLADRSMAELKARYQRWERHNALEFTVLAVAASWLCHRALVAYAGSRSDSDAGSIYTVRPGPAFWYVPAIFFGCVLAGVLVHVWNRLRLPGGGREFRDYANVSAGFNVTRMFTVCEIAFGGFGLLLAYFAATTVVHLRQDDIVLRRLWSLQDERYPYSAVTGLADVVDTPNDTSHFEIRLDGAETWTTKVEVVFFTEAEKQFLASKTGRPIQKMAAQ